MYYYTAEIELSSVKWLSCTSAQLAVIGAELSNAFDDVVDNESALSNLKLSTSVCSTATSGRRLGGTYRYVYKGRGSCRLCPLDNADRTLFVKDRAENNRLLLDDSYSVIDFNTDSYGDNVTQLYVRYEWRAQYGMQVKAKGAAGTGYTPNSKARIFDTSKENESGDNDLGSPNEKCPGVKGTGQGKPGEPGQPGENCVPQGNVLIIQEKKWTIGDYNDAGGEITFTFESPTRVGHIGLMDMDKGKSWLELLTVDNVMKRIDFVGLGDNSVQQVHVDEDVRELKLVMKAGGAVTEIGIFTPKTADEALSDKARSYIAESAPFEEYIPYLEYDLSYYLTRHINAEYLGDQNSCLYGKWVDVAVTLEAVSTKPESSC